MKKIDWTDFQYVASVARTGSLSATARELGVNHSTVLRRVLAFEQAARVQLFLRDSKGYQLSSHGRALLQGLDHFEGAMQQLQIRLNDYDAQLEDALCVTTTYGLFHNRWKKRIFQFVRAYPGITLDLQITDGIKNLSHLESDVALRPSDSIPDGFFGTRIDTLYFHVYASQDLAPKLNAARLFESNQWIGYSGDICQSPVGQILTTQLEEHQYRLKVGSIDSACEAAKEGMGLALLPDYCFQPDNRLVRVSPGPALLERPLHILARKELQSSRKVQSFFNFMAMPSPLARP